MAPVGSGGGDIQVAALARRKALAGTSGPMALVKNAKVFDIACFACLGVLLYGYNQGVFSGVLTMNSLKRHLQTLEWSSSKQDWLFSILELGAWFETMYSGFLAEILSRKWIILINVSISIVGVVVQCTAITGIGHSAILGGRFVIGMGVGSLSMIVPIYNAEVTPPEVRGALVGLQQLSIMLGIMVPFWIDYGTDYIGGTGAGQKDSAWLIPLALQLAPAVLLGVGMLFMPFSPRWLVHHNRENEARRVLAQLRGLSQEDELIELEHSEIRAQSLFEKKSLVENFPHLQDMSAASTFKLQFVAIGNLFTTKGMFKRVMISVLTMLFQQWTGINAILYCAPIIFDDLGLSSNSVSLLATSVVGIIMFLAMILISGAIGMDACHFIISRIVASFEKDWPHHQGAGWAVCAMVWLFVVFFGYSWGPYSWIVMAKIWPLANRPYSIALGASSNRMNNFMVGQVTPDMLTHLRCGTYMFFDISTVVGAAFIIFFFPETKGLSLKMDHLSGSVGTAQREKERWNKVYREVGLAELLERCGLVDQTVGSSASIGKEQPSHNDALEKAKPAFYELA
ncbi:hypothetical protein COCMIDRAFT_40441 [Bipolaris oryzae ATCC 44560]|uniref:Major facilitator superfamily (MFS) profile domain-containing protein n=1 Tax=Bipolaris oryzae ATCC 44560 TaxID=930090 RepID=W6ZC99_COCMI|nr:uncharacterized protein COCMIDRAFT_40441 [Bipolaris oryzae ATCC 44560]EUC41366.1 hypothetical protein COCMIDRAFT_40441 [Bipolaris oryzae ATCC 44560]